MSADGSNIEEKALTDSTDRTQRVAPTEGAASAFLSAPLPTRTSSTHPISRKKKSISYILKGKEEKHSRTSLLLRRRSHIEGACLCNRDCTKKVTIIKKICYKQDRKSTAHTHVLACAHTHSTTQTHHSPRDKKKRKCLTENKPNENADTVQECDATFVYRNEMNCSSIF